MTFQNSAAFSIAKLLRENYETALMAFERHVAISGQAYINTSAADVRRAIKARRDRDKFLPGHLFAEPAWDMLLGLYVAELDQICLAISSLCNESEVPATTALRWISALVNEGLVERQVDPLDARRIFVRLSPKGVKGMEAYFQANAGR